MGESVSEDPVRLLVEQARELLADPPDGYDASIRHCLLLDGLADAVEQLQRERDDHRERGNANFATALEWRANRDRLADGIRELCDGAERVRLLSVPVKTLRHLLGASDDDREDDR